MVHLFLSEAKLFGTQTVDITNAEYIILLTLPVQERIWNTIVDVVDGLINLTRNDL